MLARNKWTLSGVLFGLVLFVFAFGDLGAGHGTYIPIAVFSAPIIFIPFPPLVWGVIGWLLDSSRIKAATILLVGHTVIALPIAGFALLTQDYCTVRFLKFEPEWFWSGFAFYAVGLIAAWCLAVQRMNLVTDDQDLPGPNDRHGI